MRFVSSYIPPSLFMILGIVFFDHVHPIVHFILWTGVIAIGFVWRKWSILMACSVIAFQLGIFLRTQEEQKLKTQQEHIKPYLNMPFQIRGEVISHPIPSKNSFSYVLLVNQIYFQDNWKNENFRIQIRTKSYQSPEKKDVIEIKTKLFVPTTVFEIQRIKGIQAYGTVYGDHQWKVLETANAYSTQIRSRIFDVAKLNLSPVSYGYYRAMVFGDQAFLGGAPMERLKETGLLHLFVISGSHIAYVWLIGFWFFRILLSGFGVFHRNKRFFLWIETGSIFTVFIFLLLINPPISTYRAVGSMLLFLLLKLMRRYQQPLWNLGVVFSCTLLINPLFLFDISTQLTFGSVAGILCACEWMNRRSNQDVEKKYFSRIIHQTVYITMGATLFTVPILYFQLGVFYPGSILYNLILTPTLGVIVSVLSVLSLAWSLLPWNFLNKIMFSILDYLYLLFEKILFWKPPEIHLSGANLVKSGSLGLYCLLGVFFVGTAFIIARHFLKERES